MTIAVMQIAEIRRATETISVLASPIDFPLSMATFSFANVYLRSAALRVYFVTFFVDDFVVFVLDFTILLMRRRFAASQTFWSEIH
jgi:hypothetical protein